MRNRNVAPARKRAFTTCMGVVALTASCAAVAQSSVTLYGVLDLGVGVSRTGAGVTLPGGSVPTAPSAKIAPRMDPSVGTGSRLGFRGIEDLGGGLNAHFTAEMGLANDTGAIAQGGLGFGRQIFVGVGSNAWTLSAGRQYTPMLKAFATSEVAGGYWGNVNAGALSVLESIGSTPGNGTFQANARADNSVLLSVVSGPLTGNVMLAAGNENERGTGRSIQGGLFYSEGALKVNAAYARLRQNAEQILPTAQPEWLTQWVLGTNYDFGVARVFVGAFEFRAAKNKANLSPLATVGAPGAHPQAYSWDKNRALWAGVRVPLGAQTLSFQVARETFPYRDAPEGTSTLVSAVYEYTLSKRTLMYANYGQVRNNDRARSQLLGAVTSVPLNGFGADPKAFSLGVRHTF